MTYGELKTQFQGLLNRRDITPSLITTFVQQGISRCQRQLRVPAMEKALVATIGSTYNGLTVPGDFLELIDLQNSCNRSLSKVDLSTAKVRAAAGYGIPEVFARQGSKWFLGPAPNAADTVRIDYYAEFDAVSADGDTNVLLRVAPDLPMYAALSYAGDYFLDDRAPAFEARYKGILGELQDQADSDELAGGAVVGPAFCFGDD